MGKCPYCKFEISFDKIKTETKGIGFFKQEIMYCCPQCDSIIGVSRGKFGG